MKFITSYTLETQNIFSPSKEATNERLSLDVYFFECELKSEILKEIAQYPLKSRAIEHVSLKSQCKIQASAYRYSSDHATRLDKE